ncbi:cold-responsive protein kinase 1-like [Cornus florida]|uniref:cold-responsive protein kinase 1-like n=1 Tax=Cornus florida TaxID=4283 RepID=UPI002896D643|nr:cold-responsive protein kinase 1-like [Cornus florida]
MKTTMKMWWWRWRLIMVFMVVVVWMSDTAKSDPQTKLLNYGCSQYNATNLSNFFSNLNATFLDLRSQLSTNNTHFATAATARSSDPVYAMVQCRNYLSIADCVACFDVAESQIRNCSAANGARVIYDGCFIRYESNSFYDQTTLPGNTGLCGNQTASQPTAFDEAVKASLADLQVATPRINGFFAATKTAVVGGNASVYAVAQCAETVSETGCQDCLTVAYGNIQSCSPDTDGKAVDAGCFLRYSETAFFADNQTVNITPFLGSGGSSTKKKAIIGGVVGGVGLLLIVAALFSWYYMSSKPKATRRGDILGATELQGPVTYSFKDLKTATKNFSEENKLGEGGFGDVYKGTLKNGNVVAVKKLDHVSSRAKADFETEVKLISNVHHRNLIRLLGCSNRGPELLLVYEYMGNGSLDKFLYGEKRGTLSWKQRFDIIFGMARGLAYLHDQFHVCIIHRDIKSSNILLDDNFQAKIADFGLVRLLPADQSHVSTRFVGTLGYTAPEYAIHGQLSEKVDTYSFGIVALEIISGQRSNDMKVEAETEYLLEKAWKLHETDMHLKLVDETLDASEYKEEDVKKIMEIALMCTQSPASLRPTMSEIVVLLLSEQSAEPRRLSRSSFVDSDLRIREDTFTASTGSTKSHATASITDFTGR